MPDQTEEPAPSQERFANVMPGSQTPSVLPSWCGVVGAPPPRRPSPAIHRSLFLSFAFIHACMQQSVVEFGLVESRSSRLVSSPIEPAADQRPSDQRPGAPQNDVPEAWINDKSTESSSRPNPRSPISPPRPSGCQQRRNLFRPVRPSMHPRFRLDPPENFPFARFNA